MAGKLAQAAHKGMGFNAASESVSEREHIPMKRAKAIIASSGRNASAKAKKANPNLKKIKGNSSYNYSKEND